MSKTNQTREEALALLRTFMERQRAEYGLVSSGVFGSLARGEAQSGSDVDIVFETNKPNLFRTANMKQDLEELLSRPVDVFQLRGLTSSRLNARIEKETVYV